MATRALAWSVLTSLIEQATSEGIKRFVVGGVIKRSIVGQGPMAGKTFEQILVLKRHINDFMPQIYELPSGKVDEGENLKGALFREIAEETGLVAKDILSYVNYFDYKSNSGAVTRQFNFEIRVQSHENVRVTEHDGYAWILPEEMPQYNITPNVKEVIEKAFGLSDSKEAGKRKERENIETSEKASKKTRAFSITKK